MSWKTWFGTWGVKQAKERAAAEKASRSTSQATIIEEIKNDDTHPAPGTTPDTGGVAIIHSHHLNQGTSFSARARDELHLKGLVPPAQESIQRQEDRVRAYLNTLSSPLEKHVYLGRLRAEDTALFYRVVVDHLTEITPLIYTPVVGEACQKFSLIYTPGTVEGLFLSIADKDNLDEILSNWPYHAPDICVMTDGSRILGLGDLGLNGMGIPIGKLSLYVAAAGFDPSKTLPVTLDMGTDTEKYLNDPLYLGTRRKRPADEEFYAFVDAVMAAFKRKWPKLLVQFEDFSSEHAFGCLERYRNQYLTFNDDIQGTGAVILAGFINAINLSRTPLPNHRVLFFGAGSAGVGVASQLKEHFIRAGGMSEDAARDAFWLVDSKGLVTFDRGDKLPQHKTLFARRDNEGKQYKSLKEVLEYVRPTALIGLSSQGGAFGEEAVRAMKEFNERPIVFPLSNPATNAECTFEQAMNWTDGKVIFASGTAFPAYEYEGKTVEPGQGNNMYIFPGLGLGAILAKAEHVSDDMVYQTAATLAEALDEEERSHELLYPHLTRIREVSALVAKDVVKAALREGNCDQEDVLKLFGAVSRQPFHDDAVLSDPERNEALLAFVKKRMWDPHYAEDEEVLVGELKHKASL
ncbi:hypothetical protein HK097_007070 [Rhizophlyctis rosea]|uniref:Malic enzyme n=1 Tax=Rhizophlyctis rosea TaxID=64517 RepID=A0AAD5X5F6_9FUNG|nr:hypothetical protein HK097_007070 [Rhizophlyctis rosea]